MTILGVLLYGSECCKTTASVEKKLKVFQTKCLWRTKDLLAQHHLEQRAARHGRMRTLAEAVCGARDGEVTCPMSPGSITRTALRCSPRERGTEVGPKRHGGKPWRRTSRVEAAPTTVDNQMEVLGVTSRGTRHRQD